jgi:hypothetical protein
MLLVKSHKKELKKAKRSGYHCFGDVRLGDLNLVVNFNQVKF